MDELTNKLEEIKKLNRRRFDYVMARAHTDSISAAMDQAGVSRGWYYEFPEEEREYMERLAEELHYAHVISAQYKIQGLLDEAVDVIASSLRERDKRVKLDAAKYAIDVAGVKAPAKSEVKQTGSMTVRVVYDDDQDTNAR